MTSPSETSSPERSRRSTTKKASFRRDTLAPRLAARAAGEERAARHALLERFLFMEGIGHGKATLGKFGGSAGGDVTFFLTVEAENFPLAGKRLQYFVEPLGIEVGQHGKRGLRCAVRPGQFQLGDEAIFLSCLIDGIRHGQQFFPHVRRHITAARGAVQRG